MRFHIHRDPDWQTDGMHNYYQCKRCGARRLIWFARNIAGPAWPGWEGMLRDKHGRHLRDSGWKKP